MNAQTVIESAIFTKLVDQSLVFAEYVSKLDGKLTAEFQSELDYTVRELAALFSSVLNAAEGERQLELHFAELATQQDQDVGV